MITAKQNDIARFTQKLKRATSESALQRLLIKLCDLGTRYARQSYNSPNINVGYRIENGVGIIEAEGEAVAYIEFGTGERGRGAYEGNLPDGLISFHSNAYDTDVTVQGWTYSYAKELGLTDKPWSGMTPRADMWKTAQYLRSVFIDLAKDWWKNEKIY